MRHLLLFENYNNSTLVYHGTNDKFDKFRTSRKISGYGYSMGAYFSDNRKEANRYGDIVEEYYIKYNNILDLTFITEDDKDGKYKFFDLLNRKYNISIPNSKSMIFSNPYFGYTTLESIDKNYSLVPKLKSNGIDAMKFNEGDGITYVIFNKNQINKVNI